MRRARYFVGAPLLASLAIGCDSGSSPSSPTSLTTESKSAGAHGREQGRKEGQEQRPSQGHAPAQGQSGYLSTTPALASGSHSHAESQGTRDLVPLFFAEVITPPRCSALRSRR